MAASVNKAILVGNLTKDPEARKTNSGKDVCAFSIATNHSWKDASGEKKEQAEYHNIVAWGKLSEICVQYLKKGSKIYAEGRITNRQWEAQDGTKRSRTEIVLDNMVMLGSKGKPNTEGNADMGGVGYDEHQPAPNAPADDEIQLSDIPF